MAVILICIGSLTGTIAALVQWFALDATALEALGTYFGAGLGLPAAVGTAAWAGHRIRGLAPVSAGYAPTGGGS